MRGYVIGVAVYREEVCIVFLVGVRFITGEADKTRYGYILGVGVAGVSVQLRAQRREGEPWVALVIVWRGWTAPSVAVCLIGVDGSVFEIRINFCSCRLGVAVRVIWAGLEGKGSAHNIEIRERGLWAKLPSAHASKAFCTYERRIVRIAAVMSVGAYAVNELCIARLLAWRSVRGRARLVVCRGLRTHG